MAPFVCPRGHLSSDPDFCSDCGLRIPAGVASAGSPAPAPQAGPPCPDCGTPRSLGARFCEVCRHDFGAGPGEPAPAAAAAALPSRRLAAGSAKPGAQKSAASAKAVSAKAAAAKSAGPAVAADRLDEPPQAAQTPASPAPAAVRPGGAARSTAASKVRPHLWALVRCDRSLIGDRAPATGFPEHEPERSYPLDLSENLLGRRNARRDLHPEIPINDPSVSARHLKICRRSNGSLTVVDVGSSNGTLLNGAALDEGVEAELGPGDSLTLGLWTRVIIEAR